MNQLFRKPGVNGGIVVAAYAEGTSIKHSTVFNVGECCILLSKEQ